MVAYVQTKDVLVVAQGASAGGPHGEKDNKFLAAFMGGIKMNLHCAMDNNDAELQLIGLSTRRPATALARPLDRCTTLLRPIKASVESSSIGRPSTRAVR